MRVLIASYQSFDLDIPSVIIEFVVSYKLIINLKWTPRDLERPTSGGDGKQHWAIKLIKRWSAEIENKVFDSGIVCIYSSTQHDYSSEWKIFKTNECIMEMISNHSVLEFAGTEFQVLSATQNNNEF